MAEGNPKVPLHQPIATRDGSLTKDSKMVNCYAEAAAGGVAAVIKRPGTVLIFGSPASGPPQGQCRASGLNYNIRGDALYNTATGVPIAIPGVTVPGQQYSVLSDTPVGTTVLKSASGLWVFNGLTLAVTKVTDVNYPATTAPGITYLDGVYYVLGQADAAIHGSALEDPTTWPALNFIGADASFGAAAGIARHLNYIVLYMSQGIQFYYDAGVSPGIALQAVGNASWTTGTASGYSVAEIADVSYFLSANAQSGFTVSTFNGLAIATISTPFIEKILNVTGAVGGVFSYGLRVNGHTFYVLTITSLDVTLVYDTVFNEWSEWSSVVSGVEQYFTGVNPLESAGVNDLQDLVTGNVVQMITTAYTDFGAPINVFVRTQPYDWGTLNFKRFASQYVIADTVTTTLSVRYSDDDYNTFSVYRSVDMSTVRKMLQRCGRSRRRSWDFLHEDNTPLRLYEMEMHMTVESA